MCTQGPVCERATVNHVRVSGRDGQRDGREKSLALLGLGGGQTTPRFHLTGEIEEKKEDKEEGRKRGGGRRAAEGTLQNDLCSLPLVPD